MRQPNYVPGLSTSFKLPDVEWNKIRQLRRIFKEYKNENRSSTANRVTDTFLTLLSDKKVNVFIIAAANDVNNLLMVMLRLVQFDVIFNFFYRPTIFQRKNKYINVSLFWSSQVLAYFHFMEMFRR